MIDKGAIKTKLQEERLKIVRLLGWSEDAMNDRERASVQEKMPQSGDDEFADSATGTFSQELDAAYAQRFKDRLAEVDVALLRLAVNQYGKCVRCGREIPENRLEAIPETPFCVECGRGTEALG